MEQTGANWLQRLREVSLLEAAYLRWGETEGGEYISHSNHIQALFSRLERATAESD